MASSTTMFNDSNNRRPSVEISIETHKTTKHSNSFFSSTYKPTNSTEEIAKILSFHRQLVEMIKEDDARIAVIVQLSRMENGLKLHRTFASLNETAKFLEDNHYLKNSGP